MSPGRTIRRSCSVLALSAGLLAGCDGCSKSDAPPPSALRFIPADADVVLEIRDIGLLIGAREVVAKNFGAVVPAAQIEGIQKELTRAYGFDPSTKAGLQSAGLPSEGKIVAHLMSDGKGAVWILPVQDQKKLEPQLLRLVKSRIAVDETKTETVGGDTFTVYKTQFGADEVDVAAHVFRGPHVLLAAGRKSVALLKAALALKPEQSLESNKVYAEVVKDLPAAWDVRAVSASGGNALKAALRTAAKSAPQARALLGLDTNVIAAAGWSVKASSSGLETTAKLRLTAEGKKMSQQIFASNGAPSAGVRSVAIPETVLHGQAAMNVAALLDFLAPVGSPARSRLDKAKAKAKEDSNIDFEKDILPLLTGHAALSMGVGGLDKISFKQLVGNPMGAIWTAVAIGVSEVPAAIAVEKRLDGGLKEMQIKVVERSVKGKTIRSLVPPKRPGSIEAPVPLVETSGFGDAWVFANEPALMDQIAKNESGASALGGKGGAYLELNVAELNKQLAAFRYGNLPIVYRSLLAKALDALKLLSAVTLRVHPDETGVVIGAEITLVPMAGS